jgi:hypothetical protein
MLQFEMHDHITARLQLLAAVLLAIRHAGCPFPTQGPTDEARTRRNYAAPTSSNSGSGVDSGICAHRAHKRRYRIVGGSWRRAGGGHNCKLGYTGGVNFNLYLDRDAAARLTQLAKRQGMPRNRLIRQAVDDWLAGEADQWPVEVLKYEAKAALSPFESHRRELSVLGDDPLGLASGHARRPNRVRRKRVGGK